MYDGTRLRSAKFTHIEVCHRYCCTYVEYACCVLLSVRRFARARRYISWRSGPQHHTHYSLRPHNSAKPTDKKLCCLLCILDIFFFGNGQTTADRQCHEVHRRQERGPDGVLEEVGRGQQGARQNHQDDVLREKRGPKQSWQCRNVRQSTGKVQLIGELYQTYFDCDSS